MTSPNLFLIGAPKCGTTSLSLYLAGHPDVFFCDPKEPFFWNADYPELRRKEQLHTVDDYRALFAAARPSHRIVAEGSTSYLSSDVAIPSILAFNPESRFIAMVRNPVDAIYSWHGELVYTSNEDVEDFEQAWRLQSERAAGRSMPPYCREPRWVQYREMGLLGRQITRFFSLVPASQRMVLVHDDYAADTPGGYRQVLSWLGLPDDGRSDFPRLKQSRAHRFEAVHRFFRVPPRAIEAPIVRFRRFVGRQQTGPVALLKRAFVSSRKRPPLRPEFLAELKDAFRDDVALLGDALGRDLSHWTA